MHVPQLLENLPLVSRLRGRRLVGSITFTSAMAFMLFGYDQGVLGGLTTQPTFLKAMGNPSPTLLGVIAAIYDIGAFFGALFAACYGMATGRRWAILTGCIFVTAGASIQASACSQAQMICGRIIAGFGNGINTSTIPIWVSETTKPHRRGAAVAIQVSIVILGLFFAYWLDYGCVKHLSGDLAWRFPIAFQAVFSITTIVTIVFLPESPRWLYAKGFIQQGDLVIARLRDVALNDSVVARSRESILNIAHLEKDSEGSAGFSLKHIFQDPTEVKPTRRIMLSIMVQFFQVFSGIALAVYYLDILFEVNLNFDYEEAALLSGFNTFTLWIGTLPSIWLVEKIGRRQILLFGSFTMAIFMITFTVCIVIGTTTASYVGVAVLFLWVFFYGLCWQPVYDFPLPSPFPSEEVRLLIQPRRPWIYPAEISPLRYRHIGGAAAAASEWLFAFVVVMAGPSAIAAVPWLMYFIFSVFTVLSIPFVYFCVPETRGLSLEELDFVFQGGKVRDSGRRNREIMRQRLAIGNADVEASEVNGKHIQDAVVRTSTKLVDLPGNKGGAKTQHLNYVN